jgi:protein SCO1
VNVISFSKERRPLFQHVRARQLTLAALGLFVLLITSAACAPQLKGTSLQQVPAPPFQLNDYRGNRVSLADLKGKVVVLTFLYTYCPDECPLIAEHLRATTEQLGDSMNQVAFVAVSVDPVNDTPDNVQDFLTQHQLIGKLTYLVGTADQLSPVWSSYFISVEASSIDGDLLNPHSIRVIVIDKQGRQRVNLGSDLVPADLAFDIRTLAHE